MELDQNVQWRPRFQDATFVAHIWGRRSFSPLDEAHRARGEGCHAYPPRARFLFIDQRRRDHSCTIKPCLDRGPANLWEKDAYGQRLRQPPPKKYVRFGDAVTERKVRLTFSCGRIYCYDFDGNLVWNHPS